MFEPTPRWRWLLVPPQWFRTILAFGAFESIRIWRNPDHPFWSRRRMNDCQDARAIYRRWWGSLKQSQRSRFLFGLPRPKWRPTARIIWPPQFHPEIARINREQEAMREWGRLHPDRDPIECPIYQERVARLRARIGERPPHDC
jgi:hypothetical protein